MIKARLPWPPSYLELGDPEVDVFPRGIGDGLVSGDMENASRLSVYPLNSMSHGSW